MGHTNCWQTQEIQAPEITVQPLKKRVPRSIGTLFALGRGRWSAGGLLDLLASERNGFPERVRRGIFIQGVNKLVGNGGAQPWTWGREPTSAPYIII
jgi:hypothetical protein